MIDFLADYYLWIKALHIISVIAWMAGMFYLPRLFVYHADARPGSELSETLKVMERKLLRIIMNPAFIAAWVFGIAMMVANPDLFKQGWFHVKLTGVVLMSVFHHVLAKWRKTFAADENKRPHGFYRKMNEVPTILMIIIILMAVPKPF